MTKCRLSPLAFGLSLGVIWGASVLVMGLLAFYLSYGTAFVSAMGVLYIGYESSIVGSIIGGVFGFIDAFVGGALIAWLYNCFSGCCKKSCD
ncbi:MAG: bacteriophage holin [Legionella sp.]|nr:bacteriophage holin [Legionella sp.]